MAIKTRPPLWRGEKKLHSILIEHLRTYERYFVSHCVVANPHERTLYPFYKKRWRWRIEEVFLKNVCELFSHRKEKRLHLKELRTCVTIKFHGKHFKCSVCWSVKVWKFENNKFSVASVLSYKIAITGCLIWPQSRAFRLLWVFYFTKFKFCM